MYTYRVGIYTEEFHHSGQHEYSNGCTSGAVFVQCHLYTFPREWGNIILLLICVYGSMASEETRTPETLFALEPDSTFKTANIMQLQRQSVAN